MQYRCVTLRFDEETGRFDDTEFREFFADKNIVSMSEHFFFHGQVPYWALLVGYVPLMGKKSASGREDYLKAMGGPLSRNAYLPHAHSHPTKKLAALQKEFSRAPETIPPGRDYHGATADVGREHGRLSHAGRYGPTPGGIFCKKSSGFVMDSSARGCYNMRSR